MFYFISRSPRSPSPPILPPHLFCLPHSVSGNLPIQMQTWKKHTAFRERAEMWGEMASTTTSPQPTPRGHGDPSVVSVLAHAQRMGYKTLCEVCFDIPPHPHCTHHFKNDPRSLGLGGVPLETRICKPRDLLRLGSLLSPRSILPQWNPG